MSVDLEGIYPVRLSVATLEKAPDEIDPTARGELFVEWPRPPRVGTKIRLELSFGEEAPIPLPAMVTWSRPPRVGTMAGFRARLEDPPPLVMDTIERMVEKARDRVLLKQIQSGSARKAPVQREAVVERNSARSVDGRADVAQARGPIPPPPPSPPRRSLPDERVAPPPPPPASTRRAPASVSLPPLVGPHDNDLPEFEPGSGRSAHHEFVGGSAHERSDAIELDSTYDSLPLELETYASRAAPPPASAKSQATRNEPAAERPRPLQPSTADMSFAPSEGPLEMATIPPPPIRRRGSEFIGVDGDDDESLDLGYVPPSVLPARAAPPPKPVPAPPPLRPPPAALPVSAPRPSVPLDDDDAFDMAFDMGPPAAPVQKPVAVAPPTPKPSAVAAPAAKPSAPPPARRAAIDPDEAAFDLTFDLAGPPAGAPRAPLPSTAAPPPARPPPVTPAAVPAAPRGLDASIFDDVESLPPAPNPALGVGPPPLGVETLPPEPTPIRIGFANLRSFQMHYRLFLSQQRVYCTVAPFPTPGEPVALVVDLPDGIAAHTGLAIVEAHVMPPHVPAAGWVAVLLDPDGSLEGRIRNAAQLNGIA